MADPRICEIHPSIDGGTELWIQSSMEPPNAHWMEGWHTPKPHTEWWSSGCENAAWTLLGYQLMDDETGEVKKALLRDPDCPDAGYWSMNPDGSYEFYNNAKIKTNPEGKGRPQFEKLPGKGQSSKEGGKRWKGKKVTEELPGKCPKRIPPGGDGGKRQKGKKVMKEPPNKCPKWTPPEGDGGNSGASSSSSMPKAANKVGPSKAPWIDGPKPPSTPPRPSLFLRRPKAIGAPFRESD